MLPAKLALGGVRKMLQPSVNMIQQARTTYILKRRTPPGLDKKGGPPKPLKAKHFIYDFVEDTNSAKQPDLKLILNTYVEGVGMKDEVVSVRPNFGRTKLLLPGLAVYASPENLEKLRERLKESNKNVEPLTHSSRYAELTKRDLASWVLDVLVSQVNPWTIEKMHIRTAFRRSGIWVPDHAITMSDRKISGPDMELEKKIFLVTVKINNLEVTPVRCMIRHWSSNPEERLAKVDSFKAPPYQPVFEDEAAQIAALPLPNFITKRSRVI